MRNDITDEYNTRVIKMTKPDIMSDFYNSQVEMIHDARMLGYNICLNNKLIVKLSENFMETINYNTRTDNGHVVWIKQYNLASV